MVGPTAEWARAKAAEYRAARTILSDMIWRIQNEANKGGRIASMHCGYDAPGHAEAVAALKERGFEVSVTRDSDYNRIIKTCVKW